MADPIKRPVTAMDDINANVQSSSPNPKITLIGLACLAAFIAVVTLLVIYR
jgi:hypothetical protein